MIRYGAQRTRLLRPRCIGAERPRTQLLIYPSIYLPLFPPWKWIGGEEVYSIAPLILNLGSRWRWVFNFNLRPIYLRKKKVTCVLNRKLGRPHIRYRVLAKRKIYCFYRLPNTDRLACSLFTTPTRLSLLKIPKFITYLFTPWSRVFLAKLIGSQLVKKIPAFCGTRWFITASAHHLSLFWASSIQSILPNPTSWRSIINYIMYV